LEIEISARTYFGNNIHYAVIIKNNGPDWARDVVAELTFPDPTLSRLVSISCYSFEDRDPKTNIFYDSESNILKCLIESLPPDGHVLRSMGQVYPYNDIPQGTVFVTSAKVSSIGDDTNLSNNQIIHEYHNVAIKDTTNDLEIPSCTDETEVEPSSGDKSIFIECVRSSIDQISDSNAQLIEDNIQSLLRVKEQLESESDISQLAINRLQSEIVNLQSEIQIQMSQSQLSSLLNQLSHVNSQLDSAQFNFNFIQLQLQQIESILDQLNDSLDLENIPANRISTTDYGSMIINDRKFDPIDITQRKVKLDGEINDYTFGTVVMLIIEKPDGTITEKGFGARQDGTFHEQITLDDTWEPGRYVVKTTYQEKEVGVFSFLIDMERVPEWVKNNAKWWSEGSIGDSDFVSGIQYLIKEKIMIVSGTTPQSIQNDTEAIPSWIKNNAGWWADGLIGENDFVNGIKWLVEKGIIRV